MILNLVFKGLEFTGRDVKLIRASLTNSGSQVISTWVAPCFNWDWSWSGHDQCQGKCNTMDYSQITHRMINQEFQNQKHKDYWREKSRYIREQTSSTVDIYNPYFSTKTMAHKRTFTPSYTERIQLLTYAKRVLQDCQILDNQTPIPSTDWNS